MSSTPPPAKGNVSMMSSSSISSSRSIRTADYLIAERQAQPLPSFSATNATEFTKWAYLIMKHFKLIPGFTREVLERPRYEISFGPVPDAQVTFLIATRETFYKRYSVFLKLGKETLQIISILKF